jgi:hypothetical protein
VREAKLVQTDGGVEVETEEPKDAYPGVPKAEPVGYRDGWL